MNTVRDWVSNNLGQTILAIVVAVISGVIVAWIIQDARWSGRQKGVADQTETSTPSDAEPTQLPTSTAVRCIMPELIGLNESEALKMLTSLGFKPVKQVRFDQSVLKDVILSQEVSPGTAYGVCTGAVTYTVSLGLPPTQTPTPTMLPTATPTPPSPTPTPDLRLFWDDFSQGLKDEWQIDIGQWTMVDGHLTAIGYDGDNGAMISVGSSGWKDIKIDLDTGPFSADYLYGTGLIGPGQHNALFVLVRIQDPQNFVLFQITNSEFKCAINKDDNLRTISEFTKKDAGEGNHHVRLEVRGNLYEFLIDNDRMCFFEDDSFSNGKVGFYVFVDEKKISPLIDNFIVTQLID